MPEPALLGVVGDLVQDVVVWPGEPQRHATDTKSRIRITRGGSAANVAALAAPRCPTRFIGCVGEDFAGRALMQELEDHGVEVRVQRRGTTGVVVVMVDPDSGERSMFPSRGASGELARIDEAWLEGVALLHLTGYSLQTEPTASSVLDATRRAKSAGAGLSLDASSTGMIENFGIEAFRALLLDLAPDILSANRDETELLGLTDGERAGPLLERLADSVVLARNGPGATRIYRGRELVATVPVPPVETIRDLTGAGDAFNAGFLAARLRGQGLDSACAAGHALAGRVLACPGASTIAQPPDGLVQPKAKI